MWHRGLLNLFDWGFFGGGGRFWKGGYIGIACFCGIPMYFTMICAEIRFGWDYVASRVAYFDRFRGGGYIGIACFYGVLMYSFFGYIGI